MARIRANHSILIYFLSFGVLSLFAFQNCSDDVVTHSKSVRNSENSITETFVVDDNRNQNRSSLGSDGSSDGSETPISFNSGVGTPTGILHPTSGNAGRPVTRTSYCNDPAFSNRELIGECLVLFDTFDRDVVAGRDQFNWLEVIDDSGRTDALNVQANIFKTGDHDLGESLHENHAVYLTGGKGASVHEVFLVSRPLDLSVFNEMRIEFNYLPIHLEGWSGPDKSGWEHIRLDICSSTQDQCVGPVAPQNSDEKKQAEKALRSDHWKSIWLQPGFGDTQPMNAVETGDGNDGRNQIQASWLLAAVAVDLDNRKEILDKSRVIFRITVLLDGGFKGVLEDGTPNFDADLEDAIGLDYLKVFAIQDQL